MASERNAPCPCGSGKKYKKCCLPRDEAAARAQAAAARSAEMEERQEVPPAQVASQPPVTPDIEPDSLPSESTWPRLSEADQQIVDAWWAEVGPVYEGKEFQKNCGWALQRVLTFLDSQPRLFRYLDLHDQFLFELAGALARAGRIDDHLALLRRLRREQPEMYFECFGYYDEDLLTEALRTGRREDIPDCLSLFRQHPVTHTQKYGQVVNLLAWRGCETELRALLEATAQTIADSPDVFGGDFGLLWLTELTLFPFLEVGDDSPPAVEALCRAAFAVGFLDETLDSNREWLRRAVRLASRSPSEAGLDLKETNQEWFQSDVGWSFTGWARRHKGLAWSSARFLADALIDYWSWREDKKKPTSVFGLNESRLDRYLAQRCRDWIAISGVRALSTLQAFHYFTEYLVAHNYFSAADAGRLQSAAARYDESIRKAVDSCDAACRICPTYAALIDPPKPPASTPAPGLVVDRSAAV
jgi:hypothetical protein